MTIMQNRIRDSMVGMVTEAGIPKSEMLPGMAVQILLAKVKITMGMRYLSRGFILSAGSAAGSERMKMESMAVQGWVKERMKIIACSQ